VCSEFHAKHVNTLCGQNVEFLMLLQVLKGLDYLLYRCVPCKRDGFVSHPSSSPKHAIRSGPTCSHTTHFFKGTGSNL
jgi:hypothetical protein